MKPRIRSIKPEMWADEKVAALSRDARLLLLGLVTMADDEGRFRARRSQIWGHVFAADEDALARIDEWVDEIKQQGIVLFYVVDGTPYGAFRNWRRHQKINKPSQSPLPPPPSPKVVRDNSVTPTGAGTETYRNGTGDLHEKAGRSHSPMRGRAFRSDPDLVVKDIYDNGQGLAQPEQIDRLCELLASHVRRNDPKADPNPAGDRWQTDMRLLLADRKGEVGEVARIIDWCQRDEFWRSNILSPGKLRKQFTQLLLRSGKASAGDPRVLPFGRRAEVIRAANAWQNAPEYRDNGA